LEGHAETIAAVDVSRDGLRAASAAWDGSVRVWDLRGRTIARVLEGHGANVTSVRFSTDGQVLASGGWDGTARLWDPDSGKTLAVLSGHDGNVTAVALHPAGRQLATGCDDGVVRLFDPRAKRPPRVLAGHAAEVTGLAFTPDGRFLVSSSRDRTVRVWDVRRGESVRSLSHPAMVLGLALVPAANLLATACADHTARLWHLDWEPETLATATAPAPSLTLAGTPSRAAAPSLAARPAKLAPTRASTLREDLSRNASGPVRALRPRATTAARRVPWKWILLGIGFLLATGVTLLLSHRPPPRPALSPQMARSVPAEIDLIDVAAFADDCRPDEYQQHLEALLAGTPSATDVACVAERGSPGMVATVLDGAPLNGIDGLETHRFRRNAASALTTLDGEALDALCERLSDPDQDVRTVAAMALGVAPDPAASDCLRQVLLGEPAPGKDAAARAMRQRIARGLVTVEDGWQLVQRLLAHAALSSRLAGLGLAPLFVPEVSVPAVQALAKDADPELAEAARRTLAEIDRVRGADALLHGRAP
jgi:hypothetical protein